MTDDSQITLDDVDSFLKTGLKLADKAIQGQKIVEATQKGRIATAQYHYEPAPGFDGRIRELARDAIFRVWEDKKRAARLKEIYPKVLEGIKDDIEAKAWPSIWNAHPDKRTVDRRVNELADDNPAHWGVYDCPPCVCIKAGFYQPNPYLFDESVRTDIVKASMK